MVASSASGNVGQHVGLHARLGRLGPSIVERPGAVPQAPDASAAGSASATPSASAARLIATPRRWRPLRRTRSRSDSEPDTAGRRRSRGATARREGDACAFDGGALRERGSTGISSRNRSKVESATWLSPLRLATMASREEIVLLLRASTRRTGVAGTALGAGAEISTGGMQSFGHCSPRGNAARRRRGGRRRRHR